MEIIHCLPNIGNRSHCSQYFTGALWPVLAVTHSEVPFGIGSSQLGYSHEAVFVLADISLVTNGSKHSLFIG